MKIPVWDDNAVRNAGQNARTPVYIASCEKTKLDDVATKTYQASPDDIARLGFAVAHELNPDAPAVQGISDATLPSSLPSREGQQTVPSPLVGEGQGEGDRQKLLSLAKEIASALKNAKRPVIVSGTGCMSQASSRQQPMLPGLFARLGNRLNSAIRPLNAIPWDLHS